MKLYDEIHMRRAISLAKKGEGWCHPNPLVGAVIVKGDRVIGEGFHEKYGSLHAERNAIASLIEPADGATIYVTLEPCAHHGHQPPCVDAIIENGIKRVVIGSRDPNPVTCGKGAAILKKHGIEVVEGFLKEECDSLNPIFFHYITTKKPYVIMKYAMTADGKIATKSGESKWISNADSRGVVQRLRHACMGIMIGIDTLIADDPMLNCRRDGDRNPTRIICDSHLRIPIDSQIVKSANKQETIVSTAMSELPEGFVEEAAGNEKIKALLDNSIKILNVPGKDSRVDLEKLMTYIGEYGIDSILLEGGGKLNDSALEAGIVNEVRVFIGAKIFGGYDARCPISGEGVSAVDDAYELHLKDVRVLEDDVMLTYIAKAEEYEVRSVWLDSYIGE